MTANWGTQDTVFGVWFPEKAGCFYLFK